MIILLNFHDPDRTFHSHSLCFAWHEPYLDDKQPAPQWWPNSAFVSSEVGASTCASCLELRRQWHVADTSCPVDVTLSGMQLHAHGCWARDKPGCRLKPSGHVVSVVSFTHSTLHTCWESLLLLFNYVLESKCILLFIKCKSLVVLTLTWRIICDFFNTYAHAFMRKI